MIRLDLLGILLTLFLLGPRYWRHSLVAVGLGALATLVVLLFWQVPLAAFTIGGIFSQVEPHRAWFRGLVAALAGPFVCYSVARMRSRDPLATSYGGWDWLMPWNEPREPLAAALAKYGVLAAIYVLYKLIF